MANMNHNRLYLKYIDNLRHVLVDTVRSGKPENIKTIFIGKDKNL